MFECTRIYSKYTKLSLIVFFWKWIKISFSAEGDCDVIVVEENNSSILTGTPHENNGPSSMKVFT